MSSRNNYSKSYKKLILCLCFLTFFNVSCANRKASVSNSSSKLKTDVVKRGKNYKITATKKSDHTDYHYLVYNNNGKIMFEETIDIKVDFSYISSDILRRHNGGGNVSQYKYFNLNDNLVSQIYDNPSLVENGKIVYMTYEDDKIKLIISDLFDKSKFYKEYNRDFSPVAAPYNALVDAKFIDSSKLQITYLSGSNRKQVTEIINLN